MIVTVVYKYERERSMFGDFGRVYFDEPRSLLLTAECEEVGETAEFPSGIAIVWTDETAERMRAADLSGDELEGCVERVEDAFNYPRVYSATAAE